MGRSTSRIGARKVLAALEGLEDRALLSTVLPDIAMTSATTQDSRGVTVTYDIENAPINQPITFSVDRSEVPAYATPDIPAGSFTVNPPTPGQTGTLDSTGQSATAVGHHVVTMPLPGGLPIVPADPYVVVVADPNSAIAETTKADNSASFRTYVIGVITHGGKQPTSWVHNGPPWEQQMALDLSEQGYDAVIPVNWVGVSNTPGAAAKVAPRVVPMIEQAASTFPPGSVVDLHLIGHSEGAVINSLVVRELNANGWPANLQAGYLKVTMLDPHAANSHVQGPQYSVSNDQFGLGIIAKTMIDNFQSKANDPLPVVTPNVQQAEVFFQHTPVSQAQTNDGIYNLWGQVPVKGNAEYFNLTAEGVSHSGKFGVQNWYLQNVVPTLGTGETTIPQIALTGSQVTSGVPDTDARGATHVTYEGHAAADSTVRLFAARASQRLVDPVGWTTAGPDGSWSITTPALAPGRYRVIASSDVPRSAGTTILGRRFYLRPTAWLGPLTLPLDPAIE
jgi:hypothetical protein